MLALVALLTCAAAYGVVRVARMFGYLGPRAHLGSLPLVEVPAARGSGGDVMVVLLSADGGWARLDEELAARLAQAGYPVVGWNSLRYYMTPRDPAVAADDLSVVMRTYQRKWRRDRVLLVGYSFGADVLPLVTARLDAADRANVAGLVLLGFWKDAEFKFRPREAGGRIRHYETLPAVRGLVDFPILCISGDRDTRSVCDRIGTPNTTSLTFPAGHGLGAHAGEVFKLMQPFLRDLEE
ncbi:MAG: AcvB/VirJ family lysyl-phosphatidylglycerol hydrolase [Longimicrobiaceae bacterium]